MSSRGNGLADRPGGLRGPEAAESASAARGTAPQVAPGTVPIRVLVFERSRLVAAAVGGLLAASPAIDVVGWLADPDLLLAQARECRPEVLVAWCVPGDDPADRVRQMRAALPATSILVIVAAVSHEAVRGCVEAGASGCIADECSPAELIEAISQVHAGGCCSQRTSSSRCSATLRPPERARADHRPWLGFRLESSRCSGRSPPADQPRRSHMIS